MKITIPEETAFSPSMSAFAAPKMQATDLSSFNLPAVQPTPQIVPASTLPNMYEGLYQEYGQMQQPMRSPGSIEMPDDEYLKKAIQIESGGKANAHNKGSGAYGIGQFLPSTAKPMLAKMGKTWDDYKKDPNLQVTLLKKFTDQNRQGLIRNGIEPTPLALYAAHQQGLGGAIGLFKGGKVNQKNLAANLPKGVAPTVENWKKYWGQKFI